MNENNEKYCPICQMPLEKGQVVKSSPKGVVHEECFELVEIAPPYDDSISYEIADDDDIPF